MLKQTRKTTEKFESVIAEIKQHYSGKPEKFKTNYNRMSHLACLLALNGDTIPHQFPLEILKSTCFGQEGINLEMRYWEERYKNMRLLNSINDKLTELFDETADQNVSMHEITSELRNLSTIYEFDLSEEISIINENYKNTLELFNIIIDIKTTIWTLLQTKPQMMLFTDKQKSVISKICKIIPCISRMLESQKLILEDITEKTIYLNEVLK